MSHAQLGDTATLLSDALRHVEHGYTESNAVVLARCTRIARLGVAPPVVGRSRRAMGSAIEAARDTAVGAIVGALQDVERVRTEIVERPDPTWLLPEPLSGPPSKLVLEHEIFNRKLESVLLLHSADTWRLDDLLRQGRWLTSLDLIRPKRLDLATHSAYLPLFATDGRVGRLIDATALQSASLQAYDLVVVPTAAPPERFHTEIRRGLYVWENGWAYTRRGAVIASKGIPTALRSSALIEDLGTALPPAGQLTLEVAGAEAITIGAAVRSIFGNDRPVIVYNPAFAGLGASTGAVRWRSSSRLTTDDHATLIRALRDHLPAHNFLVASVMRPGDVRHHTIQEILRALPDDPGVKGIMELEQPGLTTLRGFSQVLSSGAVAAMVQTTHPTNTHLGAALGLPSFMVGNDTESFVLAPSTTDARYFTPVPRWPEAPPTVGVYHLDTQPGPADLGLAAHAFATHVNVHTKGVHYAFDDVVAARQQAGGLVQSLREGSPRGAVTAAKGFADVLRDDVRDVYTNIAAVVARMRLQPGFSTVNNLHDLLDLPREAAEREIAAVREIVRGSMLHKLARFVAAPKRVVPVAPPNAHIYRKVRANVPLNPEELAMLGVQNEQQFAERVRVLTSGHMASIAQRPGGQRFQVGWQHLVTLHPETVVKSLSTNTASEYLTDEYTLQSIRDALGTAGGLVPPTSGIVDGNVVSSRMTLFTEPGGEAMSPLFGGRPVAETSLPLGWIDEQFENYVDLARQGVFNFDYKFKDVGVDGTGVLQVADYSAFTRVDRARPGGGGPVNRRTDVYHMGVNELIRNGQFLGAFANGRELTDHFLDLVHSRVGIDLRPHMEDWEWGDHGNPEIVPLAERLREFVEGHSRNALPRPVYPLIDADAERLVYEYIAARLPSS